MMACRLVMMVQFWRHDAKKFGGKWLWVSGVYVSGG